MEKPGNFARGWEWLQPPRISISQGPVFCALWGNGSMRMEFGACVLHAFSSVLWERCHVPLYREQWGLLWSLMELLASMEGEKCTGLRLWWKEFPLISLSLACQLTGFAGARLGVGVFPRCDTFSAKTKNTLGKPVQLVHLKFGVPWLWQVRA